MTYLGYNDSKGKYYYLDPHCVQVSNDNFKESERTPAVDPGLYITQNLYEYQYEDMVTSLLLSFFFKDAADFTDFYARIEELLLEVGEDNLPFNFCISNEFDSSKLVEF